MQCINCKKEFKKNSQSNFCNIKCRIEGNKKIVNKCWIWQLKIGKSGYGQIIYLKKYYNVHRLSYEIFKGKIEKGLCVCHSCDNKSCCNPEHLWLGNQKENLKDMVQKGRRTIKKNWKHTQETKEKFKYRKHSDRRGLKHHLRKLNEDDIKEIRNLMKTKIKRQEILDKYDITRSYLYQIKSKIVWPHLL